MLPKRVSPATPSLLHNQGVGDPSVCFVQRFKPENMTESQRRAYLSFGAGNRKCPAEALAMHEIKAAAFSILSKFRLISTKDTPKLVGLSLHSLVIILLLFYYEKVYMKIPANLLRKEKSLADRL